MGCNCIVYEPDLIDLLERYKRRARDNDAYTDPFLASLRFLIDIGYLVGRENIQ